MHDEIARNHNDALQALYAIREIVRLLDEADDAAALQSVIEREAERAIERLNDLERALNAAG